MSIDKNVYQEKKLKKSSLMMFATVCLIIGLLILAGGITLVVFGCRADSTGKMALELVFGIIMILVGLGSSGTSIAMLLVGCGMMNVEQGSVKDGNSAKGTANVKLCDKCGHELDDDDKVCPNCGKDVEKEME